MVEKKKITRKVISKVAAPKQEEAEGAVKQSGEQSPKVAKSKKSCFFCQSKTSPQYTDIAVLRRFITDRAKISSHLKNNLCSKHQRVAARQIKYARHLALLPFIPKV